MAKLNRTLGLAQCVFFGVGSILGAGIYTLIGKVAGHAGNLVWLAFLFASMAAVLSAFSYAELSAAFPKAGGEYVYATKAWGKTIGVIAGCIIALNGIISGATVSVGFAGYFGELVKVPLLLASLGIIAIIFLINLAGIRESSWVNTIFTSIEAGGLIFVIYAAFPSLGEANYTELPEEGMNGFFLGAALGFFAYLGFEEIVKLAEEARKPEKNIPRALFIANFIVVVMYTVVAIVAISAIPWKELAESSSPLSDVVSKRFGNTGAVIIAVVALFSTSNTILSNMLGSSRVLLDMSRKTKPLKKLSFVWPRTKTPVFSLLVILGVMCGFAFIGNIEIIARITNFFIFLTFLVVNASVIVLRFKEKNIKRPYTVPGNIRNVPVISVLGILFTLILLSYNIYGLVKGAD